MLRNITYVFGAILLLLGILGFVPQATDGDLLLGYFRVNALHNFVHLLTGVVAILCAYNSYGAARIFFQVFGVVYGLVAVLGFYYGHDDILGVLANNHADTWLHVVIAAVSLYLGFLYQE